MAETAVKERKRVTFQVRTEPGSEVYVAGTFNNWDPQHKKLSDKQNNGLYRGTMVLPKGTHQYKFVINDTWCADPDCQDWTPNEAGTINSVITVG